MDSICDKCIMGAGCAFSKMTVGIVKCRDYIDVGLSRKEAKEAIDRVMNNPAVLTKDHITIG